MFFKSGFMTSTTVASIWVTPRMSPANFCGYYTGQFFTLTAENPAGQFENTLLGFNSQNHRFYNNNSHTVDATNGVAISITETLTIENITITDTRSASAIIWINGGTYSNNAKVFGFGTASGSLNVYIERKANDLVLTTSASSAKYTFNSAGSGTAGITYIAISLGWEGRNNDYTI